MTSQPLSVIPEIGRPRISLVQLATAELRRLLGRPPFGPGAQLPNEPELAEKMRVSRATLRSALNNLEAEGVILRRPGVGNFVSRLPVLQNNLNVNSGVADLIRAMGMTPGLAQLDLRIEPAEASVSSPLALAGGAAVVALERVRTADGKPVVYSLDYFSAAFLEQGAASLSPADCAGKLQAGQSLYRIFEERLGRRITGGVARLRPIIAGNHLARRLAVSPDAPLLCIEQLDHDWQQKPLLFSIEYHVSELCTFTIHRSR
jgi:GntR family transcriptional regulator